MTDGPSGDTPPDDAAQNDLGVVEIVAPLPASRVQRVAADASARLDLPVEKLVPLLDNRVGPVTKPLPRASAQRVADVLDAVGVEVEVRSVPAPDAPTPDAPRNDDAARTDDVGDATDGDATDDDATDGGAAPDAGATPTPPPSDAAPTDPPEATAPGATWRPPLLPRDDAADATADATDDATDDADDVPARPTAAKGDAETPPEAAHPEAVPPEGRPVEASAGPEDRAAEADAPDAPAPDVPGPDAPASGPTVSSEAGSGGDVPNAPPEGTLDDDPWQGVLEPDEDDDVFGAWTTPRATPPAPSRATPDATEAAPAPSPQAAVAGGAADDDGDDDAEREAEVATDGGGAGGASGGASDAARPADTSPWIRSGFDEDDVRWAAGTRDPFAEAERRERAVRRLVLGVALALAIGVFGVLQWIYA